jgi:hypothetical protein
MTSIAHAWTYILGATSPMPIYAGFYMSFILLFANIAHQKKSLSRMDSYLLSTTPILVALTPEILSHASVAYTNLPYTTYFLAALIPLLNFGQLDSNKSTIKYTQYFLSALMLVSAVLTRFTEPFYISVIVVAVYQALKSKKFPLVVLYPLTIYAVRKLWMAYAIFGDELSIKAIPSVLSKFSLPFFLQVERFLLAHYLVNITLPLFIMCSFVCVTWLKRRKLDPIFLIFWAINLGILFLGGFFFASQMDIWKDIGGSAERMVMVFIPIFYLWAVRAINRSNQ